MARSYNHHSPDQYLVDANGWSPHDPYCACDACCQHLNIARQPSTGYQPPTQFLNWSLNHANSAGDMPTQNAAPYDDVTQSVMSVLGPGYTPASSVHPFHAAVSPTHVPVSQHNGIVEIAYTGRQADYIDLTQESTGGYEHCIDLTQESGSGFEGYIDLTRESSEVYELAEPYSGQPQPTRHCSRDTRALWQCSWRRCESRPIFMDMRSLAEHIEAEHVSPQSVLNRRSQRSVWNCALDDCTGVMNHRRSLLRHVGEQHLAPAAHRCPLCPDRFNRGNNMRNHIRDWHRVTIWTLLEEDDRA